MTLAAPVFLETSPAALVDGLVSLFEATTGRALYPAQYERLLIDLMAYREALVRMAIQDAAQQLLVPFSRGTVLEGLGALVGIEGRLAPVAASTTLRITLPALEPQDQAFAAGWSAIASNGVTFALEEGAVIPAGSLSVDAKAVATTGGAAGNGILAGSPFSPLEGIVSATNLTTTAGGAEEEDDDQLRARTLLAPFGFSVGGSAGAYRYHALGAHPSLVDVSVETLGPLEVGVYPLTRTGLPSVEVLEAVQEALSGETVRPLCDLVTVVAPTRVPFTLEANLTVYRGANPEEVLLAATDAGNAFLAGRRGGLRKDLVASQAITALAVEGVYKVELVGWADRALEAHEWADGTLSLHYAGTANV